MEAQTAGITPGAPPKPDPVHQWREELKNYRKAVPTLAPDDAARTWLSLFERVGKLPTDPDAQSYGRPTPYYLETLQALPPPAAWEAMAAWVAELPPPEEGSRDFTTPVL